MLFELRITPGMIHGRNSYLTGLWSFIICIKCHRFFSINRNFFQLEHACVINTGIQLVVKGMDYGNLCVVGIILLHAVFINQLVHLLVETDALTNKHSGTESGTNQVDRGFIDFLSADLLFKHTSGMIYWHREFVVKELINVRAEELVSGVDVSNAFPSENDGKAPL